MAAMLLFCALAVVWLRPLPWQMGDHVTGPGDPLTTAWRLVWPAQWLLHRGAPLWDTNVLYPAKNVLARDELTLGESLIAGPLYAITHNALLAYNCTLLITLALCGFTMYCLAWDFLRSHTASVIAGMIFTLAPYHLAQLDHAGLLAVQWLPLEILFLDRTLRHGRWRDASLLGLTAFLQAISAGYYAYWSAIILLLFTGYVLLSRRYHLAVRTVGRVGAGLVVALVMLVPIVLPFVHVATREAFARPLHEVEYWSARPQTWLAATPNNLLYGPIVRAHAWTWSTELYLFPGVIALLLAVTGIVAGQRHRIRWLALALTVCGFVLTLGPTLHLTRRD
ncbi:MAG: YfhO family protein, partial [Ktedonobacterales bacterium]|nr:YfhO family protein [Ktedonobacterales bacterium]